MADAPSRTVSFGEKSRSKPHRFSWAGMQRNREERRQRRMPCFHDEGWATSHLLLSALYGLVLSSMCPWDVGPTANERGGIQTHICQMPKLKSYHATRNALCVIRKQEEAAKDPREPSCPCSLLNFMHKPSLSPTSPSTLGRHYSGQPPPWPWLGCTGCHDPDVVRGPRSFFDLCLLVLDFVLYSSFWERVYCPFSPVFWPLWEVRWINMKLHTGGCVDFLHKYRSCPVLGWVQCQHQDITTMRLKCLTVFSKVK